MQTTLPLALTLLAAARTVAQDPLPPVGIGMIHATGLTRVLIDEPGDGNVWVLAPGYKARFGTDGVDFISFYGSHAPRNFPVSFRLRGVERGEAELQFRRDARPVIDGLASCTSAAECRRHGTCEPTRWSRCSWSPRARGAAIWS